MRWLALIFPFSRVGLSASLILFAFGCTTAPEHTVSSRPRPNISATPPAPVAPPPPPAVVGNDVPPAPGHDEAPPLGSAPPAGPGPVTPAPFSNRHVALILGSGGVRSFAHIGVLRELERHHIPVEAVIGLEWGALPAALYAQEGRANDAEWQMFKMKPDMVPHAGLLKSSIEPLSTDGLNDFLKTAFADHQTSTSRVRFMCPYSSHDGEHTGWANSGRFRELLALCMPYSPLYETHATRAAPFSAADAMVALRRQGYTDIVMVNVLGQGSILAPQKFSEPHAEEILWSEIRASTHSALMQSNWPIDVPAHTIGMTGLDHAHDLVALGQKAAAPVAEKMAQSLGLISGKE